MSEYLLGSLFSSHTAGVGRGVEPGEDCHNETCDSRGKVKLVRENMIYWVLSMTVYVNLNIIHWLWVHCSILQGICQLQPLLWLSRDCEIKLLIVDNDPRKCSHICSVPNIDTSTTPFLEFNIIKEDVACFGDKSYPISIHHFTKNEIYVWSIFWFVSSLSSIYRKLEIFC